MERVGCPCRRLERLSAGSLLARTFFPASDFLPAASDWMLDLQDSHMNSSEGLPHTPHAFFGPLVFASPRKV